MSPHSPLAGFRSGPSAVRVVERGTPFGGVGAALFQHTQGREAAKHSNHGWDEQQYALNYIVQGKGVYQCQDRTYELGPGSVFQRVPGVAHRTLVFEEDYCESYLFMAPRMTEAVLALRIIDTSKLVMDVGVDETLVGAWHRLYESIVQPDSSWRATVQSTVHLLSLIFERSGGGRCGNRSVRRARQLLDSSVGKRESLTHLASELGMHVDTFRKWYAKETGESPNSYRIRRRVERARELLRATGAKQVAYELGYSDTQSFSRQFRQYTGMSPREYRLKFALDAE